MYLKYWKNIFPACAENNFWCRGRLEFFIFISVSWSMQVQYQLLLVCASIPPNLEIADTHLENCSLHRTRKESQYAFLKNLLLLTEAFAILYVSHVVLSLHPIWVSSLLLMKFVCHLVTLLFRRRMYGSVWKTSFTLVCLTFSPQHLINNFCIKSSVRNWRNEICLSYSIIRWINVYESFLTDNAIWKISLHIIVIITGINTHTWRRPVGKLSRLLLSDSKKLLVDLSQKEACSVSISVNNYRCRSVHKYVRKFFFKRDNLISVCLKAGFRHIDFLKDVWF